jgi:hypothetical protein
MDMQSLCWSARMYLSVAVMLLLPIGLGLMVAAWVARRHLPRLATHAPLIAKLGGIAVLGALVMVLFYLSIPLLMTQLVGGNGTGFDPESSCYESAYTTQLPCDCGNLTNCACLLE